MKREKEAKAKKKKKSGRLSTIILVLILLTGLGIMLYPTISDYWNSFHQTRAIAQYDEVVAQLDDTDYESLFAAAEAYNEHLRQLSLPYAQYDQLEDEYYSVLDVARNGIIGYVDIPKIDVELPIYHGTSEQVLNMAVGHLEGSSLPIGGESRHAVLSAHRGLPSAKLFTDLDKMEVGDTFTITVLNQVLTYEVDQILIVEPAQLESLNIVDGEDYCTLLTCTPYGINTHRLLVRGHRIENEQGSIVIQREAIKIPAYIAAPAIAIPILFILLLVLMFTYRRKPKRVDTSDVRNMSRPKKPEKTDSEKDKK